MKKYILLFFILISFVGFIFGDDDEEITKKEEVFLNPDPQIYNVILDDKYLKLFGSGFNGFSSIYGKINDYELDTEKINNSNEIILKNYGINGNLFINLKALDIESGLENKFKDYQSKNIYILNNNQNFIKYVDYKLNGEIYNISIELNEPIFTGDIKLKINNSTISPEKITLDGGKKKIDVEYNYLEDSFNFPFINIYLEISKNKYGLYSIFLKENNNFTLKNYDINKNDNLIRITFKPDSTNYKKLFLSDGQLNLNNEKFKGNNFYIEKQIDKQNNLIIYSKDSESISKKYFLDYNSLINPKIERIIFEGGNITGSKIKIEGENLGDYPTQVKLKIDGLNYELSSENNINLISGGIIYNFEITQGTRYDFKLPFNLSNNNGISKIKVEVNGIESNEIEIELGKIKKSKSIFGIENKSINKIGAIFSTIGVITGEKTFLGEGINNIYFGNLKFTGDTENKIFIDNIVFNFSSKQEIKNFPIKDINLGENKGAIKKINNKNFQIIFFGIMIEKIKDFDKQLEFELTNNFISQNINLNSIEFSYSQYDGILSLSNNKLNNNKITKNIDYFINMNYSNCIDINTDYSNCSKNGYKNPSKYGIDFNDLDQKQQLDNINNGNGQMTTGVNQQTNLTGIQDKGEIDQKKVNISKVDLILLKADSIVEKASKGNETIKKKLYLKLISYLILKSNSFKKNKEVLALIRQLIDKIRKERIQN